MELHSMLCRNIAHMSTIIRSFAGCRSFRDVREGADVRSYQRCAANVAPVALSALRRHFRVLGGNTTTPLTTIRPELPAP